MFYGCSDAGEGRTLQLGQDFGYVGMYGPAGYRQRGCDVRYGVTVCHMVRYCPLALCERRPARCHPPSSRPADRDSAAAKEASSTVSVPGSAEPVVEFQG